MTRYSDDVMQVQRTYDGIIHRLLLISTFICIQFVRLQFCETMNKFWINFSNSHTREL